MQFSKFNLIHFEKYFFFRIHYVAIIEIFSSIGVFIAYISFYTCINLLIGSTLRKLLRLPQ